jgi:hypothetical protein
MDSAAVSRDARDSHFLGGGRVVVGKEKLEFADVRWIEISIILKRKSQNGTKPGHQIKFKGEQLDLDSVQWREKVLV